jgi:hypothetical protein
MDATSLFNELKEILEEHQARLKMVKNEPGNFYLNTPPDNQGNEQFFGAVQVKKNYVAFHLMPLYCNPELKEGMSSALKKRMQGKSCFNFKKPEPELFNELNELTKRSLAEYRKQGLIA